MGCVANIPSDQGNAVTCENGYVACVIILIPHRDRENTHIISAIINIAKDLDKDWPLVIEDHFYRKHEVFLEPGEIIFYESARLLHGRPYPLQGRGFANIFCHFTPVY